MATSKTDRTVDHELMLELIKTLSVSRGNLHRDPCGDWNISGRRGHALTDGRNIYVYVKSETPRRWQRVKTLLSFMSVTQDGDDEGFLKFRGTPDAGQAAMVRKVLGLRISVPLSDERRESLRQIGAGALLNHRQKAKNAPSSDLTGWGAITPQPARN